MDDPCCLSTPWENSLKSFENVFATLQAARPNLETPKLAFSAKSVAYLGHVISAEGVAVGKYRIKPIQELPTPTCIKYLRSVSGVTNVVCCFVTNCAEVTEPLVDLTSKEFATLSRFKKV